MLERPAGDDRTAGQGLGRACEACSKLQYANEKTQRVSR